ncbi:DsbA family protein, partial [Patescibacteria group bacterium]|nr:DsbA family protein [Patescibacteria group bacterium]
VNNDPTQPVQPTLNVSLTKDDHETGAKKPSATLVVYTDFECSFCQKHHDTISQLLQNYGDKIAVVYRNFPLTSLHANAAEAAEAAECAGSQGKFFEYADALFKNQASLSSAKFGELAKTLGLNTSKFDSCMSSGDYAAKVSADFTSGTNNGIQGTPGTVLIDKNGNQQLIEGAYPYEQMEAYVKAAI